MVAIHVDGRETRFYGETRTKQQTFTGGIVALSDRQALIVGIDSYQNFNPLGGCVADATAMAKVLRQHEDGRENFVCSLATSAGSSPVTRGALRRQCNELFYNSTGDVLFYFAGHGLLTRSGGFIVTEDGTDDDPGLLMGEIVELANTSTAKSVLLIVDTCHSGSVGNPTSIQAKGLPDRTMLSEGVTILAASRSDQESIEIDGRGVFTSLVVDALEGGAADVRGRVSAAAIYGHAEAALAPYEQRPLYKSHAANLDPVRICLPRVEDAVIREVPAWFPKADHSFQLDPSYEETNDAANPANVAVFKKFKLLQLAGLLKPEQGLDLFWTAERSGSVALTALGKFYRNLVLERRI